MSELTVDTAAMRQHATALDGPVRGLAEAAQAGTTTALSGEAFGLLCSFLVPVVGAVEAAAAMTIVTASSAIAGEQGAIRASAAAYDTVDDAIGGALRTIEGMLP